MTLTVFSSRIGYRGGDAMDVTRKSGKEGLFLAPSRRILTPALAARDRLAKVEADSLFVGVAGVQAARASWDAAWADYVTDYLAEMRRSYVQNRRAWKVMLGRERVVLLCYCGDRERCHAAILRACVFPALGAVDGGEIA